MSDLTPIEKAQLARKNAYKWTLETLGELPEHIKKEFGYIDHEELPPTDVVWDYLKLDSLADVPHAVSKLSEWDWKPARIRWTGNHKDNPPTFSLEMYRPATYPSGDFRADGKNVLVGHSEYWGHDDLRPYQYYSRETD